MSLHTETLNKLLKLPADEGQAENVTCPPAQGAFSSPAHVDDLRGGQVIHSHLPHMCS